MGEEIAYRLPENISNPVADYYIHVEWDFLKDWKVVRFQTAADGSCLFHAIANALYKAFCTFVISKETSLPSLFITLISLNSICSIILSILYHIYNQWSQTIISIPYLVY